MHFVSRFLLILFALAGFALADGIMAEDLSVGGGVSRDRQLTEIRDIMRGGRGGYIDLGFYYLPMRTQTPLLSEYGKHLGYAFKHHLAGFGSSEVAPKKYLGMLLWFERSGWDGEDFFFFPQYNEFSLVRSVTTWGVSFTDSRTDWTLALGMQHQNVEHVGRGYAHEDDSLLYSWAHLRFGKVSAQANFYRTDWRLFRFSLDLESRSVYGGQESGPLTYLPNISLAMYNADSESDVDSMRVTWEQNLYGQRLYAELKYDLPDAGFHSAALKFYPDPSRMIGFEASCLRRVKKKYVSDDLMEESEDFLWGGAIDVLFARFAYNAAYDYDHLFGTKGTFVAEIKFSLATLEGMLFNRGGTHSAPLETSVVKQMNISSDSKEARKADGATKTIEAKGIRYEKAGAPGTAVETKGGN